MLDLFAHISLVISALPFDVPFVDLHAVSVRLQLFCPLSFMIAQVVVRIALKNLAGIFASDEVIHAGAVLV